MERDGIIVKLGLGLTEFERGLKKADSLIGTWTKRLTLGLGTGLGFVAIVNVLRGIATQIRDIGNASKSTGFSVETIQAFQKLTKSTWESSLAMDKLSKINEFIGAARSGDKSAIKYFKDLGVEIDYAGGVARDNELIFRDLWQAWANEKDIGKRANLLSDAMKKGGEDIAGFVDGGMKKLDELRKSWLTLTKAEVESVRGLDLSITGLLSMLNKLPAKVIAENIIHLQNALYGRAREGTGGATGSWGPTPLNAAQKEVLEKQKVEIEKAEYQSKNTAGKIKTSEGELKLLYAEMLKLNKDSFEYQQKSGDYKLKYIEWQKLSNQLQKEDSELMDKKAKAEAVIQAGNSALSDRTSFTLDEIASGRPIRGNAWVNQQILAARRVKFLEAYGKAAKGVGRIDIAQEATMQALNLRGGMEALATRERYPMQAIAVNTLEASKTLKTIESTMSGLARVTNDPE